MRARIRGDITYYYYDTGGKPRKEISLGKVYVEAIRRWSELEGKKTTPLIYFKDIADRYLLEIVPTKAKFPKNVYFGKKFPHDYCSALSWRCL
ncbi:MAG: hypothetical protein Q8S55_23805 [Methylococcaceae bacterium]|nr:hypothetical protein [Methylococcaceae bacterium]